ncbi:MAG: hypothetical protein LBB89_13180 [Treponema sp.]|jgi:hypothetical protein|nr:hypothetical protein [Treponema sp.]
MTYFTELTKMERIGVMHLALETLAKIKKLPKGKGDAIREVKQVAETYAIYLVQDQEIKQASSGLKWESSSDLTASLKAKVGN